MAFSQAINYYRDMTKNDDLVHKQTIAQAFSAAASTYDQAAYIEQEIGSRLLERLTYINIKPVRILDLGCGTGFVTKQLQRLFPQASIIGLDLAIGMLEQAQIKLPNSNTISYISADAEILPFANRSFDLVFSNCCLMHIPNLANLSSELHRVLKVDGLLLFSSFGPDSLKELAGPAPWLDMHHFGDSLLKAQFKAPVVDTEMLTFTYASLEILLEDLKQSGAYDIDTESLSEIPNLAEPCAATFEVIYGLAWGGVITPPQFTEADGKIFISAAAIKCL